MRREARKSKENTVIFYGKLWVDYTSKEIGFEQERINLTPKEYDIVEFLSMNRRQVFSKEYLYEKIWGYDTNGNAEVAVTEHIKRIRKKLGHTECNVIETIWGVGYKWAV